MEQTLERVDRRYSEGLASVVHGLRHKEPLAPVLEALRHDGFSSDELTVLEGSARELVHTDQMLRGYVGSRLLDAIQIEPALGELGGRERQVSVIFADLVGFTTFSEHRTPSEVISMLNTYWTVSVPAIVETGGVVERFAGDAVMAVFNALDDQPDHAVRAVQAALALRDGTEQLAAQHPGWPRFRIGGAHRTTDPATRR